VPYPLKKLRKILKSYNAWEDSTRGKGGHTAFIREVDGVGELYPIPNSREVENCYVKGVRRKFKLTKDDHVSDEEFFSRA